MRSTPPAPPEDDELALLIQELSCADSLKRNRAAAEIFQRGCELARTATASWFPDSQLASCFLLSDSGTPEVTIGLAVERANFVSIRTANSSPRLANVPDDQDAEEFELEFPDGSKLDILTTKLPGAGGAIERFLQRFGEGIQQIEFQVRDVDRATEILRGRFGIAPIYPQTRGGADGTRVNFFLVPVKEKKVLIELVQAADLSRLSQGE